MVISQSIRSLILSPAEEAHHERQTASIPASGRIGYR